MCAECSVFKTCCAVAYVWVHGDVEGLAKSSHEVSNVEWMALVRQCGRKFWLAILRDVPWGVRQVVFGWDLFKSLMRSCVTLVVGSVV